MAIVKRQVVTHVKELCLTTPDYPCRFALVTLDPDVGFDPGIGVMIVDPNDIAFFRVR